MADVARQPKTNGIATREKGYPVIVASTSMRGGYSMRDCRKEPSPNSAPLVPSSSPKVVGTVRKLAKSDIKRAAYALAEAFVDDEMAKYFTHTDDRKHCTRKDHWKLHLTIMEHIVRAHVYSGLATALGDDYDCVALWMPPGTSMDGFWPRLLGGMQKWNLGKRMSAEGSKRFFSEFLPKLHDTKSEVLQQHDDKSWYLVYVGTRPHSRGRGYARKLIDHTLKQVDEQKLYCYLESSNIANEKFYNSLGFEHRDYIHFTRSDRPVVLDAMVREPQAEALTYVYGCTC